MNSKTLNRFIKICRSQIDLPDSPFKHFSFILDGKKQVSFGWNMGYKTHPLSKKYGHRFSAIHSEIMAIGSFPYPIRELRHFDMLNIRLSKASNPTLAKPCKFCIKLLYDLSIRRIYYTNSDGELCVS